MPSIFRKNTTGWVEILSVFRKNTTGWVEILNAYRKNTTEWVKVFARSAIPGIIGTPKVRNSLGEDINNTTVIARVGDTLTGYRGSWSNSPTTYEDRWYFNEFTGGGSYGPFSPAQINTTLNTTLAMDGYYIVYQVRATNASGTSDYVTSSNEAYIVKYVPNATGVYQITGSSVVGGTLTATQQVGTWQSTTNITGDTSPDTFVYDWYATNISTTNPIQSSSSATYVVQPTDDGNTIAVKVTGTNTGGSDTTGFSNSLTISSIYSFGMGKILHLSTNGYVSLNNPSTSFASLPAGFSIPVSLQDFWNGVAYKWSNGNEFVLHYDSYKYSFTTSAYRATWQMRFYADQSYADFRIIRWGASVGPGTKTVALYKDDLVFGTAVAGPIAQYNVGETIRIYYSGAQPTRFISFTEIATDSMVPISLTAGSQDDGYYSVVTSTNQYTAPVISSVVPGSTSTTVTATFSTSGGFNGYSYVVRTGSHSGTLVASGNSNSGSFSQGSLSSGVRYYVTLTPFNAYSQFGTAVQFDVATTAAPGPFSINNGSRTKPTNPVSERSVTIGWTSSTNGVNYEVQLEGSTDNVNWAVVSGIFEQRTTKVPLNMTNSPYYTGNSTTFTSVDWKPYYRATARVRDAAQDLATATYSNGGSSTSYAYFTIPAVAPGTPTLGTITVTKTTASVPFTFPTNTGSEHIDWIQFSLDNSTFTNDYSSPYDISSLTAGTTYTLYYRALNYDKLYSSTLNTTFTTTANKPPNNPGTPTAGTKTNTSIAWSWTAPTVDSTHLAATGYDVAHTTSSATPTSWNSQTATSLAPSNLIKNTTYWMHVRATNADGSSGWVSNSASTNNDSFYTVSFNANGGSSTPASVTQTTAGGSVTLASAITRTGFTFGGWNTNTSGTGTNYSAGASYTPTADITLYAKWTATFVQPAWNGTMPAWQATGANGSNFQRTSTALRYGWNNGTFSFSGSVGTTKGWDFYVSGTQPASTTTARTPTHDRPHSTTAQSNLVYSTAYIYYVSPTYSSNPRYGSIRPYQYGTDGNKYVRSSWSVSI
jgi:uncharacterized repeat protein (TIGR02543 family)